MGGCSVPSRRFVVPLVAASLVFVGCSDSDDDSAEPPSSGSDLGVATSMLSPIVDNPYVAFAEVRRAVYEGEEVDDEGETVELRVEATVRDATLTIAGVEVTVVDVLDYEDGELVEETEDYYAQGDDGDVYYLGESVAEFEDGELVGHGGAWVAGEDGARAGVFMPAEPQVGDEVEQERAPGVAEDRSAVVETGMSVTVPAGTFDDCIETEDFDPIDEITEAKFYCPDVGLVKEEFAEGGSLELIEFESA